MTQASAIFPTGSETTMRAWGPTSSRTAGFELHQVLDVLAVVQSRSLAVAGIAHGVEGLPVAEAERHPQRFGDAVRLGDGLDATGHALQRSERVLLQTEGQRQIEEHLRVGRTQDVGEELGRDLHQQLPADLLHLEDLAVVHEQPLLVAEGMAVRLLHGGQRGRAHVRQEERRLDLRREVAQD
jgi:hypothetical protein